MSNRITTMNHPTIEFSSMNPNQVEFYERTLKDISAEDIKMNRVAGRHALLLNMGLAGHCPLFEEYFSMRDKRDKMVESRMENTKIPWNSCKFSVRQEVAYEVDSTILNMYGWDFTEEPK